MALWECIEHICVKLSIKTLSSSLYFLKKNKKKSLIVRHNANCSFKEKTVLWLIMKYCLNNRQSKHTKQYHQICIKNKINRSIIPRTTVLLLQSLIVPWFQQRNNAAQGSSSWHQTYASTPATVSGSETQLWPWTHLKSRIWTNVMRRRVMGRVGWHLCHSHNTCCLHQKTWIACSCPLGFIHPIVLPQVLL